MNKRWTYYSCLGQVSHCKASLRSIERRLELSPDAEMALYNAQRAVDVLHTVLRSDMASDPIPPAISPAALSS